MSGHTVAMRMWEETVLNCHNALKKKKTLNGPKNRFSFFYATLYLDYVVKCDLTCTSFSANFNEAVC